LDHRASAGVETRTDRQGDRRSAAGAGSRSQESVPARPSRGNPDAKSGFPPARRPPGCAEELISKGLVSMFAFLASALIVATATQQIDTTVTVRPGSRLDLNNFEGSVTIGVWAKSAVRVQADPADSDGHERM